MLTIKISREVELFRIRVKATLVLTLALKYLLELVLVTVSFVQCLDVDE